MFPPANVVTGVLVIPEKLAFPSRPKVPIPQVHKVPSVLIAAAWSLPQLTCFQLFPPANVVTGVLIVPVVTPFPSLPLDPAPQIHKVPSVLTAAR